MFAVEVSINEMALATETKLGPYEILSRIGAEGMGEVYRAKDTRLGRTVAIKILNKEHMQRFEREARAIAALNHPHICTLHDIGGDYLVLEYVEGKSLSSPLPDREAVRLAIQSAAALDSAHRKESFPTRQPIGHHDVLAAARKMAVDLPAGFHKRERERPNELSALS
jgi:serine/threonine protein kinase